jgi:glycosyltransferase involved in cell wall biosynthesis
MRILIVNGTFPPRRFGGITSVSYSISKHLVERGHDVTVYTTDAGDDKYSRLKDNYLNFNGIKVYYFKNLSTTLAFKHRLFLPVGFIKKIKENINKFDIIHLHDYRTSLNIITGYYAQKNNVPYVIQTHGSLSSSTGKKQLKNIFDISFGRHIIKSASKVIALTEIESKQYIDMGVDPNKIDIIPNGIDIHEYNDLSHRDEFRDKYSIKKSDKVILFLGRINKVKGIDLLIEAFSDLTKKLDDVKLVIVGPDDGFSIKLLDLISKLNLSNKIILTGPLYELDKRDAYASADLYVLPSIYETYPLTVLEACASRTAVIVTNRCSIANMIGKIGCVVDYDRSKMCNAIYDILIDNNLRKSYGESGRKLVENELSWNKIVNEFELTYQSLI